MTSAGRRQIPLVMKPSAARSQRTPSCKAPSAATESHAPRYRPPVATADGPKGLCAIATFPASNRCWG
eukprot:11227665-Lingulodinium_polyedra.AAC.1